MARSPLTETIRRVQGMIDYARENLSTDEYMLFLDLLAPEPETPIAPTKQRKRKSSKKSARASGMAATISKNLEASRAAESDFEICQREGCGLLRDANDHHKTTHVNYHEFQPSEQAAGVAGD